MTSSSSTTLLHTPLHDLHVQLGARMVDFAGWDMPVLYTGIVEEHLHTRRAASMFDVSHMGRLELWGDAAETLLQKVCTRQLGDMAPGQSRYSHVCHERGGILDDVIVSKYEDHWLVVCNASNRSTIVSWLEQHRPSQGVELRDRTTETLMIALQGPKVIPRLGSILPLPIGELKRYRFLTGDYFGVPYTVARSGYTGEDGVEVILPALAAQFVPGILGGEGDDVLKPAGLGARDTLRLEAAMPLYGHELDDKIDPLSAGQAWCVDLKKEFIGVQVLRKIAEAGSDYQLVGLELAGKRIARQGAKISSGNDVIGRVTSGTLSPTLGRSIAMGYVQRTHADVGRKLTIDIGGQPVEATTVPLPFYKRS